MIKNSTTKFNTVLAGKPASFEALFSNPTVEQNDLLLRITPCYPLSEEAIRELLITTFNSIKDYNTISSSNNTKTQIYSKKFKGELTPNAIYLVEFHCDPLELKVSLNNFSRISNSDILRIYKEIVEILSIF